MTDFVAEINFVENYTDFKNKSARNSTRGLKLKISKASRSTEANDLSHAHNEG